MLASLSLSPTLLSLSASCVHGVIRVYFQRVCSGCVHGVIAVYSRGVCPPCCPCSSTSRSDWTMWFCDLTVDLRLSLAWSSFSFMSPSRFWTFSTFVLYDWCCCWTRFSTSAMLWTCCQLDIWVVFVNERCSCSFLSSPVNHRKLVRSWG